MGKTKRIHERTNKHVQQIRRQREGHFGMAEPVRGLCRILGRLDCGRVCCVDTHSSSRGRRRRFFWGVVQRKTLDTFTHTHTQTRTHAHSETTPYMF